MATITNTISLGRIQTTLPKKLYFGSKTPERPKGTRLVTVNADSSNSQHFYFCTRGDNKKEGVLATFDLLYIIERSPTLEAPPGLHYIPKVTSTIFCQWGGISILGERRYDAYFGRNWRM